jgi:hypothetical protein
VCLQSELPGQLMQQSLATPPRPALGRGLRIEAQGGQDLLDLRSREDGGDDVEFIRRPSSVGSAPSSRIQTVSAAQGRPGPVVAEYPLLAVTVSSRRCLAAAGQIRGVSHSSAADSQLPGTAPNSHWRPQAVLPGSLENLASAQLRRTGFRRRVWTARWLKSAMRSRS